MENDAKKAVNKIMEENRNRDDLIYKKIRELIESTFKGSEKDAVLDWLERKATEPRIPAARKP